MFTILRPAVLFGKGDILINNIVWTLRRFPLFGVLGDGEYGIQPVYMDDLAALTVEQGERHEKAVINAVGPESLLSRELSVINSSRSRYSVTACQKRAYCEKRSRKTQRCPDMALVARKASPGSKRSTSSSKTLSHGRLHSHVHTVPLVSSKTGKPVAG